MTPSLPDDDVRIATERLVLRPIRTEDSDAIFTLFANWNVVRHLAVPPWPYTRDDARTFVTHVLSGTGQNPESAFAILHDDRLTGVTSIRIWPPGDLQRGAGPRLGYWLGEPYWGKGYMTEAVRGLVGMVFASGASDMVYSGAFSDNQGSLRVQEKIGFVIDGETTLFSRPRKGSFAHTNTVLSRARFEAFNR